MSSSFAQLEHKLNVSEMVKDHPWPALALAVGAGVLLSGSGSDVKSAAATVAATKGASSKMSEALDDVVSTLMQGVHGAIESRVDGWVGELKSMLGSASNRMGASSTSGTQSTLDSQAPLPASRAD
jgi:hypothetical protein